MAVECTCITEDGCSGGLANCPIHYPSMEVTNMTRNDIFNSYDVHNGIITSPGKFESEMLYAPYFYDTSLDGACEELSFMEDGMGEYAVLIKVDDDDRAMFPEIDATTVYILLTESDQGFVGCQELTAKQADRVRDAYASEEEEMD